MFATCIHGRGGQGVVTAAELLSVAAFDDGHEAQAFPTFGSERMGAPVVAYCRIADEPIRVRDPITAPDAVVVLDATLLHQVDLFAGLVPTGWVLLNSVHPPAELGLGTLIDRLAPGRVRSVPATAVARRVTGSPRPNLPMLGAFAALTGVVSLAGIERAIRERFGPGVAVQAATEGYRAACVGEGVAAGA